MAVQLGPGGRVLLVLVGVAVIVFALGRNGVLPFGLGGAAEALPAAPARQATYVFASRLPATPEVLPAAAREGLAGGARTISCEAKLLLALPPRAAVLGLGRATLRAVPHGGAALERLARGEVEGAAASVAEIAAAWPLPRGMRIAAVLGGGRDLALVGAQPIEPSLLAEAKVAAPAGSAEAHFVGALGAELRAVGDAGEALRRLGEGRVRAAVLPRWLIGPAGPVGRPVELPAPGPIDPLVLVLGERAACAAEGEGDELRGELERAFGTIPAGLADGAGLPGDLVIAWAAARQDRPALPPLELAVTPELAAVIWGGAPSPGPAKDSAPVLSDGGSQ